MLVHVITRIAVERRLPCFFDLSAAARAVVASYPRHSRRLVGRTLLMALMTMCIASVCGSVAAAYGAGWPLVWTGGDNSGDWGVFVANSDGSNQTLLPNSGYAGDASVSPDGQEVAYENWIPSNGGEYTVAIQSLEPPYTQQNFPEASLAIGDSYLRWYPDGKGVVYEGSDGSIYSLHFGGMDPSAVAPQMLVHADFYGELRWPSVSPDGTRVLYAKLINPNDPPPANYALFATNPNGSAPQQLTDPSVVSSVEEPNVSPDGTHLVFDGSVNVNAGLNVWEADINSDYSLSNIHQVTTDTDSDQEFPSWASDGNIIYNHYGYSTSADDGVYEVAPNGSDNHRLVDTSNGYAEYASEAQPSPTGPQAALAAEFRPYLFLDSSEKWRPLNVDMFLNETDPTTGQAWNQICSPEQGCSGLYGLASLQSYPTSDSYISIHRDSSSDPDSYVSPNPNCNQTNSFGTTLHDCDTGGASAISYNVVGPSPGGYTYIDYWFFYRYNQAWQDEGNHAGDWEGVTIAPASADPGNADNGIAFVELSQHGQWDAYLPSGLDCGEYGAQYIYVDSCSTAGQPEPGGLNVDTFPAAGDHANLPQPNDGGFTENENNGEAEWGNDQNPLALIPFPAPAGQGVSWTDGPENWTDWPGAWGDTAEQGTFTFDGSPCGPAAPNGSADNSCGNDHGPHYYAPWSQSGTNLSCSGADCPQARFQHSQAEPLTCTSWFGAGVSVAACNQSVMQRALQTRQLRRRGSIAIHVVGSHTRAASAPGLAQLLGLPLHPGQRASVSGVRSSGTQLLVRALEGRRLISAAFDGIGPIRGRATIRITAGRNGYPRVVLLAGRRVVNPTFTQKQTLPASRPAGRRSTSNQPARRRRHHAPVRHRVASQLAGRNRPACSPAAASRARRRLFRTDLEELRNVMSIDARYGCFSVSAAATARLGGR